MVKSKCKQESKREQQRTLSIVVFQSKLQCRLLENVTRHDPVKTVTSLPDLDLQSDIDDNTNNGGQSDAATYWAGVRTEVFSVEDRLQNDSERFTSARKEGFCFLIKVFSHKRGINFT